MSIVVSWSLVSLYLFELEFVLLLAFLQLLHGVNQLLNFVLMRVVDLLNFLFELLDL